MLGQTDRYVDHPKLYRLNVLVVLNNETFLFPWKALFLKPEVPENLLLYVLYNRMNHTTISNSDYI